MIVFDGKTVRARLVPQPDSRILVVTFKYWDERQSLASPGYGEDFLKKYGLPALHVTVAANHWYQTAEMDDLLDAVRAASSSYERVVTFGSSMGGYAAMLFSGPLDAHAAIGMSALFSINGKVPDDPRWDAEAQRVRFTHDDMESSANRNAKAFLIFDPFCKDRDHAARIAACFDRATLIRVPFGGHPCEAFLIETGVMSRMIRSIIIQDDVDLASLRRQERSLRRETPFYWEALSEAAEAHGRYRLAQSAAQRADELRATRAAIAASESN